MNTPTKTKARYIMIGGFLGAGKTTAVACLAERLAGQALRVGLITNDQGSALVDTASLRSRGFATEEIAGGCFCCRFSSLMEAAARLTAASTPEVFIAEPVGSCTDLVATVTYPLRRLYGDEFAIAPLSVLVDPVRAQRVFGLHPGAKFSDKVLYIYRKQIEEADLVVISKSDLLEPAALERLRGAIAGEFPGKEITAISVRTGMGIEEWFQRITTSEQGDRAAMGIDYDVYADGEALLGWLNCTIDLETTEAVDANSLLTALADELQQHLAAVHIEIAHLKMTVSPADGIGGISAINLVRNDHVPELSLSLDEPFQRAELIINLRAEGAPEVLKGAVEAAIAVVPLRFATLRARLQHLENFRPGRPTPTHRFETAALASAPSHS